MTIFKCKMCGGELEVIESQSVCECLYCGTQQTLPRLDSDKKTNLYDRANHFRRNNDYDKAMSIYEQILNEDNTDAEAYWSLVLCKYGIEYVEDPGTHKRIPTINRAQYTSIFADENYKAALEHADMLQKSVYEAEAKTIDEIQSGILAISEKEEPFDVFICYKETDENGRRTQDSVLANELYHQLIQEGFKVFFAKLTLEDKLGQEYEPYIFAALNSAKAMVVLGTKPEYFKAVWVKNEWSRYLALISSGAKKTLIPAYRDMDPYDLPEEFSHLQAQDMSKLGFMQDLTRGIKKIVGTEESSFINKATVIQPTVATGNWDALLRRGTMALEDGEWSKADEFFEEVLNQQPECGSAYIGKLLAKYRNANLDELVEYFAKLYYENTTAEQYEACEVANAHIEDMVQKYVLKEYLRENEIRELYKFNRIYLSNFESRKMIKKQTLEEIESDRLFVRALQYANENERSLLEEFISNISSKLDQYISEEKLRDDENKNRIITEYERTIKDADLRAEDLYMQAEARCDEYFNNLIKDFENAPVSYEGRNVLWELGTQFKRLNSYKDASVYVEKCNEKIALIEKKIEEDRRIATVKKKKFAIITLAVIAIVIIGGIVYNTIIAPAIKYKKAIAIKEAKYKEILELKTVGEYKQALALLEELGDYKDALSISDNIYDEILKTAEIGDIVYLGANEEEWLVLDQADGKILVISNFILDDEQKYNTKSDTIVWENCALRKWLNEDYINLEFSDKEKRLILNTNVINSDNSKYGTAGGDSTVDQIFLLSIDEVKKYFPSDRNRATTDKSGVMRWWWLRSPGRDCNVAYIYNDGSIIENGVYVLSTGGVRPAFWIDTSNL